MQCCKAKASESPNESMEVEPLDITNKYLTDIYFKHVQRTLASEVDRTKKKLTTLLLGPIRRILSHVTASGHIFRLTFRTLSDVFIL